MEEVEVTLQTVVCVHVHSWSRDLFVILPTPPTHHSIVKLSSTLAVIAAGIQ